MKKSILLVAAAAVALACSGGASDYMEGVSATSGLSECQTTSGDRAWCVGAMDGSFPDTGWHIKGEMGGLWGTRVKYADGFSLQLSIDGGNFEPLPKAGKFTFKPYCDVFDYTLPQLAVTREQFIPEGKSGIEIKYTVKNTSRKAVSLAHRFCARLELIPAWCSEYAGIEDGQDSLEAEGQWIKAVDGLNGWSAVCYSGDASKAYPYEPAELHKMGPGASAALEGELQLEAGAEAVLRYCIAGSEEGPEDAEAVCLDICNNAEALLQQKKERFEALLERTGIDIPDRAVQDAYNYAKIAVQNLAIELPGMRFMSAGMKESPWLFGCDNTYAQQAVVATGEFELAKSTLSALVKASECRNGNGQIIHEMAPFGFVFHEGYTHETAQFIATAWEVFRWTGDEEWLKSVYPYMEKGLEWLFGEKDTDGDLLPEGLGVREVKGLRSEVVDVAAYSCRALYCMADAAEYFGEAAVAEHRRALAEELRSKVNGIFWDEEGSCWFDFVGTKEDALKAATGAAKHYKDNADYYLALASEFEKLPEDVHRGFKTSGHWVAYTPADAGVADADKAQRALDTVHKERFGEWGPYLSSVDKDKSMTINTGVLAAAEAAYGRADEALLDLDILASTLHYMVPGLMYEMLPGGGIPTVGWTLYGFSRALLCGIFGIHPDAASKTVTLSPCLPSGWNRISVKNVRVGDTCFDLEVRRHGASYTCKCSCPDPDWNFIEVIQ